VTAVQKELEKHRTPPFKWEPLAQMTLLDRLEEAKLRRLLGLSKMDDDGLTHTEEGQAIMEVISREKAPQRKLVKHKNEVGMGNDQRQMKWEMVAKNENTIVSHCK
jgi:hypothetical protein